MINNHWLPVVWGFIIAFVIFAYITLDGFDLGVGVLFAAEREAAFQLKLTLLQENATAAQHA